MSYRGLTMKPEALTAWTNALRSGGFEQGRFALRRRSGHSCCLGVFAETQHVARDTGIAPHPSERADFRYLFAPNSTSWTSLPVDWFAQFFDYSGDEDKNLAVSQLIGQLIEFNDADDKPFYEIAGWLAANLTHQEETTS